jgi:hypothetical protein
MSKNTNISELINYLSYDGSGNVVFNTVSSAATNTDKFLVSDTGVLKFRTAAQLLSDIGAQASGSYQAALSGTGFVKISGSTISYDNSTYATQTYVGTAISNLVASSPATLDTLNELALALGSDPNFATTVATSIGTKQPQLNGTGFVKISGTTISYDNSTYLTTASASSTYLPLAGGTLTGALGGTSASFSGNVVSTTGTTGATIKLGGFTNYGTIQDVNDVRRIWFENTGSYRTIFDLPSAGTEFAFRTNGGIYLLSLASTGAATFSSSVTATSIIKTGGTSTQFLMADGSVTSSTFVKQYTRTSADLNTMGISYPSSGIYAVDNNANAPSGSLYGSVYAFWNDDISTQFYVSYNGNVYWRKSIGATYTGTTWKTFLDSTTYSSYALPLTGGTISGNVNFQSTQPLTFTGASQSGTYNQTAIYFNQNSTSGADTNGIFIERGRLSDSSSAEVRYFVIGARGGQIQWKLSGTGGSTQYDTAEVKPSADADYFVGRFSAGSAKCFRAYQSGSDGYLELQTGAGTVITKLSGYTGVTGYTLAPFAIGQSTQLSNAALTVYGATLAANFQTNQTGAGSGIAAYFVNGSGGGYSSWIYIGSAPGTDWKIGKNISNPTGTTYHFEIVDSSNNVRMQINNGTGNVTFSGTVTQNSDIRLKKNIRSIENPLSKILQTRGILYDRVDESDINELGFIAQELELVLPELVSTSDFGIKSIKYQNIVAVLVEAMKELKAENNLLKDRLDKNNIN